MVGTAPRGHALHTVVLPSPPGENWVRRHALHEVGLVAGQPPLPGRHMVHVESLTLRGPHMQLERVRFDSCGSGRVEAAGWSVKRGRVNLYL